MRRLLAATLALTLNVYAGVEDWANLKALRQWERVWVVVREGTAVRHRKGEAAGWSDAELRVRIKGVERALPRAGVVKVSVFAGKSRGRGAAYGAAVGAAAGAGVYGALALASDDLDVSPAAIVGAAALLFGGVGAVVGLAVGATKTRTVYEAAVPQMRHK